MWVSISKYQYERLTNLWELHLTYLEWSVEDPSELEWSEYYRDLYFEEIKAYKLEYLHNTYSTLTVQGETYTNWDSSNIRCAPHHIHRIEVEPRPRHDLI
jgi:hypothetical protein